MEFVKIADSNKKNYMELLLIADEQEDMIEKYLCRGDMFALIDDGVKAVCVVTEEKPGVYEIKNIAVIPKFQRKGYGLRLMS
ncbi:MAG: GNAT family N-acetyltransferase, partial [Methanomicrobium sp.]|nr:GNAT family N-acetyltransferase [Methanomicrobium sp.]